MSNHLRVVAVISSGIGPQGKISVIQMLSMVISEDLMWKKGKGEEELYLVGVSLGHAGQQGCHSLEIQVQRVCTCYCVALMTFFSNRANVSKLSA